MKNRRVFNVIICFVMVFFMLFVAAGCFENPDRDYVVNPETNQDDISGNSQNDDSNKGDDTNNRENNNEQNNDEENNDSNQEQTSTTINILGFGDSIAAGYAVSGSDMYVSYTAFNNGEAVINDMCYTNIIAGQFENNYDTVNVKSYAKSGDKTDDLIAKFNKSVEYPNLANDVENADIITLCIGANNVLTVALNNLADYLEGSITINEIEVLLQQGVEDFKNDYTNTIIPYLTQYGAEVYVMTIYDPYYYFSIDDIEFTSSNPYVDMAPIAKTYLNSKFNSLKTLAIQYLDEVNSYIKSQSFENVIVVDVNASFKMLSKAEYSQIINADSTKISINIDEVIDLNSYPPSVKDASSLMNNPYFDPHPTSLGQKYIANLFLSAMGIDEVTLS